MGINVNKLDELHFYLAMNVLKVDTGHDLESVGLSAQVDNVTIDIYANLKDNFKMLIGQFSRRNKISGEWEDLTPTHQQLHTLRQRLNKEIENLYGSEAERAQLEIDEAYDYHKYGHPGALYSKFN